MVGGRPFVWRARLPPPGVEALKGGVGSGPFRATPGDAYTETEMGAHTALILTLHQRSLIVLQIK